ncbi:MAG TPA: hypothetical protein PKY63_02070 [Bacteroidales bacterium]|nr:hypothetical protein [Bacteroidales bacterium]
MTAETSVLLTTTASIAIVHTLAGPDHYLPFIAISKARNWSLKRTVVFTFLCGLGHVGSSVLLGIIGVATGIAISHIELWEGQRGSIVSVLLMAFGLGYFIWGTIRAIRNKPHTHLHLHENGEQHEHIHSLDSTHGHAHTKKKRNITPWILFTIFIFGPCEPLILLVMYPAAESNYLLLITVTALFAIITIGTMITLVVLANRGFHFLNLKKAGRYAHAIAGFIILLCGIGMVFLGL